MRPLRLTLWLALVFFSLTPVGAVDGLFQLAVLPSRFLVELAPRLRWLERREVRAAEAFVAERAEQDSRAGRALRMDLVALAAPTLPELRGRDVARADVLRYLPGDRDRIEVKLYAASGVRVGCPVVSGNAYVGRIEQVDYGRCLARVKLVTARDSFVGARVVRDGGEGRDAAVRMTVGGVDRSSRRAGRTRLVVHNPSQRRLPAGSVVVDELDIGLDPLGLFANGFSLGRVALDADGAPFEDPPRLEPDLDYKGGLFQVNVLLDPNALDEGVADCFEDALEDQRWVRVRQLSSGDPSHWRGGLVIDRGFESGVRRGAALVSGARLLGRVDAVGPWRSDVRLLTDPGVVVVAAARVEGMAEPQILGELVSLGREVDGSALLDWKSAVAMPVAAAGAGVEAQLFSGAGEDGLPPGLVIGRATLATHGAGSRTIRLLREVDPLHLGDLWVRVEDLP